MSRSIKLLPWLAIVACKSAPPAPPPAQPALPVVDKQPEPQPPKAETQPVHTVAQIATPQDLQFPDEAFRAGRAQIMGGFAGRERIYLTPHAHAGWTARARENLATELADLRG